MSGPIRLSVGANGTINGTWSYEAQSVYDATVGKMQDHSESSWTQTDGVLSGSLCDFAAGGGHLGQDRCHDSVLGDCSGLIPGLTIPISYRGAPTSNVNGQLTWAWALGLPDGSSESASWSISVSRP
ncbi:MAG TPA: hypothetical protein VID26_03700 [Candidatus Limnocylindrales bacterium]|jgi:hypothetical protein